MKLRVEGRPDFATMGPVVLAPNHISFLDPPILQLATGHHLTFLMTATIFKQPLMKWFFRFWNAIPVPESGAAAAALKVALRAMRSGRPVVIFPEGGISTDGQLKAGRGGVGMLILKGKVPVIPVAILGTFEVLPRHRRWPPARSVTIRVGAPIRLEDPPFDPRTFAQTIMQRIAELQQPPTK